jgi:allophanate hydrolase
MTDRVAQAYARLREADRPEVFVHLRDEADVAAEYAESLARGSELAGVLLAVKDNVDVAGLPTTAACPGYRYVPDTDAAAVAALRAAGAVVVGKTNLDQFATGLVGTRSPYGAVRDARRPEYVSGGSSSGSAVAVALGVVDIAIGTDTAGSGRVPAAFQGIVGIKPTVGTVATTGVVPACASYDCVTIFARDLPSAERAVAIMATAPGGRPWAADVPLAAAPGASVAVPRDLPELDERWRAAFAVAVEQARAAGLTIVEIELDDFLAAARLLYDGALVAERWAAVGEFVEAADSRPGGVDAGLDPVVAGIVRGASRFSAVDLLRDRATLATLRERAMTVWGDCAALLVPTAPFHPTIAEVAADPVGVNSRLGTYTNFCNLFDLCAVAVPAGMVVEKDGSRAQFGVTVLAPAGHDAVAADIAASLTGAPRDPESPSWPERAGAQSFPLIVFGAHLHDQPLAGQLTALGARWAGAVATAPEYRMTAVPTRPPKPAVVRCTDGGAELAGERWVCSPAALGRFLAALPSPMGLGAVQLGDGTWETGFVCGDDAASTAPDITAAGSWRTHLAATLA